MTFAIFVIAFGVAILLAGGPTELFVACENALRAVAEAIYQWWVSFRR
jgi:hypothetical protein